MRRRAFISLLGGAAAAWPLTARTQQPPMPVIGFLYAGSPETSAHLVAAFRKGLGETGYVEGHSVAIEFRFAQGNYKQLPELAAELVARRVAVIATPSDMLSAFAAKAATSRIPIVFGTGGDPVQSGLVPSLNRPGGNITGISVMTTELAANGLELLKDLIPRATRVGVFVNSDSPLTEPVLKDLHAAAESIGFQLEIVTASTGLEIDGGFATLLQRRVDAVMNVPDVLFTNRRVQIAILAVRRALFSARMLARDAQCSRRHLPRNASTIAAEKAAEWRGCGEVTRLQSTTTGASCTQVAPAASASGCTTSSG